MKKALKYLAFALVIVIVSSMFSACGDKMKKYVGYYFDDSTGSFKTTTDSLSVSEDLTYISTRIQGEAGNLSGKAENNRFYVGEDVAYYFSDYYFASDLKGVLPTNSEGKIHGEGELDGKKAYFTEEGKIIVSKQEIGNFSVTNNYIKITLQDSVREYLALNISDKPDIKKYGLFDRFFCSTKVVATSIENTGFTVYPQVLLAKKSGEITLTPNVSKYTPKSVLLTVIDNGGYSFSLGLKGEYELKLKQTDPTGSIKIKAEMDGLSKIIEYNPIAVAYSAEMMKMRNIGEEIDLNQENIYRIFGVEKEKVTLFTKIVDGNECAEITDNILKFNASGYIVIQLDAHVESENGVYYLTDRTSINITEKKLEKK